MEYKWYKFSDIADSCLGKMLDKEKNTGTFMPYLANINVRWGDFDLSDLPVMRFEKNEDDRYGIKDGDLIMCEGGEPGRCAIWRNNIPCMKIQKALHRIRVKNNTSVEYLYYWFYFAAKNGLLKGYFTETTIKHLTGEALKSVLIYLPSLDVQKSVSKVLSKIDAKIRLNKKINDNLMQMASTVFLHYFINRVPNGKLGSVLVEHKKSNIQVGEAQDATGDILFFTSGDSILKWNKALVDDRCCYLNTGGNADVKFYVGKAAYSTDTWCISGKDGMSDYIYLFLNTIKPELNKKFFQGTGLKHLQKPLLRDRLIYIPTADELSAFNAQIMPMMTKISENTRENQQLLQLRDWLLPMLMNGQVTVAD